MTGVAENNVDEIAHPKSGVAEEKARAAANTTMFGAAIMLFFGFLYLGRPFGDDLFHRAGLVLYYTLRIGGLAFAGIAILLYLGQPIGLLLDGILALPCGVILLACGVLMLTDGGDWLNTFILVFGGISFFPTGWNNLQASREIRSGHRISDNSQSI